MDEEIVIELLKDTKEVFDKYGVEYWLDCGTLLGAIRDGKVIPWDHDLDFGTWKRDEEKTKMAFKELSKKGYHTMLKDDGTPDEFSKYGYSVELFVLNPNIEGEHVYYMIVPIHIFGKALDHLLWMLRLNSPEIKERYGSKMPYKMTEKITNMFSLLPKKLRKRLIRYTYEVYKRIDSFFIESSVPCRYFRDLKNIKFYGMDFKIPKKSEDYLVFRYGKDWKKPKKNYVGGAVVKRFRYGGKDIGK